MEGAARIKALVQQIVFTATPEPEIARVLITQDGGATAVIGGEGLVIDSPATRERVAR